MSAIFAAVSIATELYVAAQNEVVQTAAIIGAAIIGGIVLVTF